MNSRGLHSLIYVSKAVVPVTLAQLTHLLERAHVHNAEAAVTGTLLYVDGVFMQYLEGTRASLDGTYARIQADPFHHALVELLSEPVDVRAFPDWRMGFVRAAVRSARDRNRRRSRRRLAMPAQQSSTAHHLLNAFWRDGPAFAGADGALQG